MLSERQLEAIRARWLLADECESDGVCLYLKGHPFPDASYIDCDVGGWSLPQTPDAWAHGKQDVADLLAEVEALRRMDASGTERLKELLGRWVKACGVYRVAAVIPYGGSLWRCDFCNAESHEGPDRVPHTPTCLVGQTERVLAECEHGKEA